jgi:hypothetical protein
MKPNKQRIAIAEACGLTIVSDGILHHLTPCGKKTEHDPEGCLLKECPDYLNDLHAMHKAEKILTTKELWESYKNHMLIFMTEPVCATAAQRAEAFLRTLDLWKP